MTLVDNSKFGHSPGAQARQVAAGDTTPAAMPTDAVTLATPQTAATNAAAAMAEGDGLGMLALGLVVIGAYLARR